MGIFLAENVKKIFDYLEEIKTEAKIWKSSFSWHTLYLLKQGIKVNLQRGRTKLHYFSTAFNQTFNN
jgi:hypothetical protein